MPKLLTCLSLFACICLMSACGTTPKRTPYSGSDLVGEVDSSLLVGNWNISVLNPVGEENSSTITQSFNQDGTWTSTVIPPAEQTEQFGQLQYEGHGEWQVDGESVVSQLAGMKETTGNKFGGMMQAIVSALIPKKSTANVYEQSDSRVIFVHEGTGQATLLERI